MGEAYQAYISRQAETEFADFGSELLWELEYDPGGNGSSLLGSPFVAQSYQHALKLARERWKVEYDLPADVCLLINVAGVKN